jgi:hypothetical protein
MKFGSLVFPSSNDDHHASDAIAEVVRQPVTFLARNSEDMAEVDAAPAFEAVNRVAAWYAPQGENSETAQND